MEVGETSFLNLKVNNIAPFGSFLVYIGLHLSEKWCVHQLGGVCVVLVVVSNK